jgi:hypothetical protein
MRITLTLALSVLLFACGALTASAQETAGAEPAWSPQDTFRVGFDASIGYYLPWEYDPGFDLAGPSWGITISFVPFIVQTPVFQLAGRAGADLIAVVLFEGGKEAQLDAEAGLVASFGSWRRVAPFLAGGTTLTRYAITTPNGTEAGEGGWGYRFGAGIHIRVGEPQRGSDSINQFITPGVLYGRMFLETVEVSYLQFQVAFTGFMGI